MRVVQNLSGAQQFLVLLNFTKGVFPPPCFVPLRVFGPQQADHDPSRPRIDSRDRFQRQIRAVKQASGLFMTALSASAAAQADIAARMNKWQHESYLRATLGTG